MTNKMERCVAPPSFRGAHPIARTLGPSSGVCQKRGGLTRPRLYHSSIHPRERSSVATYSADHVITERRPPECSIAAVSYEEQQIARFKSCCLNCDSKIDRRGSSRLIKYEKVLGFLGSIPCSASAVRSAFRVARRRTSEGLRCLDVRRFWLGLRPSLCILLSPGGRWPLFFKCKLSLSNFREMSSNLFNFSLEN